MTLDLILDAAVIEEAGEAVPAREHIADRLGEPSLLADQSELGRAATVRDRQATRPAPVLADGTPLLGKRCFQAT